MYRPRRTIGTGRTGRVRLERMLPANWLTCSNRRRRGGGPYGSSRVGGWCTRPSSVDRRHSCCTARDPSAYGGHVILRCITPCRIGLGVVPVYIVCGADDAAAYLGRVSCIAVKYYFIGFLCVLPETRIIITSSERDVFQCWEAEKKKIIPWQHIHTPSLDRLENCRLVCVCVSVWSCVRYSEYSSLFFHRYNVPELPEGQHCSRVDRFRQRLQKKGSIFSIETLEKNRRVLFRDTDHRFTSIVWEEKRMRIVLRSIVSTRDFIKKKNSILYILNNINCQVFGDLWEPSLRRNLW